MYITTYMCQIKMINSNSILNFKNSIQIACFSKICFHK